MRELPFDFGTLEINGPNSYGYPPLKEAIARQYDVDPDCVVTAEGTSMANYLAMATLLDAGDEVAIEHPAYGLLVDAARYIGANIKRFARREENAYAVDPAEIRRVVTPKTRLIVLTNLHNPSSVLTPDSVIREVADIARSVGARLLVDEVYLDAVYGNTPPTAALDVYKRQGITPAVLLYMGSRLDPYHHCHNAAERRAGQRLGIPVMGRSSDECDANFHHSCRGRCQWLPYDGALHTTGQAHGE